MFTKLYFQKGVACCHMLYGKQQHILILASTGTELVQGYIIWNIKF